MATKRSDRHIMEKMPSMSRATATLFLIGSISNLLIMKLGIKSTLQFLTRFDFLHELPAFSGSHRHNMAKMLSG